VENDFPGGRSFVKEALLKKGAPSSSMSVLLSSLTQSSWKQYEAHLKDWWLFCKNKSVDPTEPSVDLLLQNLQSLYERNVSYSTINTRRSAVSLIDCSSNLGTHPLISRFLKGIYKLRPSCPKYRFMWNPDPVINFLSSLEPIDSLSLQDLTYKTIGLLAFATAHRCQTLGSIKITDIFISSEQIKILISSPIKTSRPGFAQPCLILPYLTEAPQCCPARSLKYYMDCTNSMRSTSGEPKKLFLSLDKNHSPVSIQTISRWIKTILERSGVNISMFSAHSVRHTATSMASNKGISVDQIRERAGWSKSSNVFAKYYNRPIDTDQDFARAILLG